MNSRLIFLTRFSTQVQIILVSTILSSYEKIEKKETNNTVVNLQCCLNNSQNTTNYIPSIKKKLRFIHFSSHSFLLPFPTCSPVQGNCFTTFVLQSKVDSEVLSALRCSGCICTVGFACHAGLITRQFQLCW